MQLISTCYLYMFLSLGNLVYTALRGQIMYKARMKAKNKYQNNHL